MHFDWRVFKRDLKSVYSVTLFLTINGFFYNEPNFSHFSILPLHNDLLEAASNKPSTHKALSHIRQIPKNSAKSLISFSFFLDQYTRQWQENLSRLLANASYRWILLDIPAGDSTFTRQALALADQTLILIHADASCHIRLHQQNLPAGCHFLLNQFSASSRLQQDLHQLWLQSLDSLLPIFIHRDEAMAEALAAKQPLGEYSAQSLAAEEVMTLANWCLINAAESGL